MTEELEGPVDEVDYRTDDRKANDVRHECLKHAEACPDNV